VTTHSRAFLQALSWTPDPRAELFIAHLIESSESPYQALGIAAAAERRWGSRVRFDKSIDSPEPALRAAALKAAGVLGCSDLLPAVLSHLNDTEQECREIALWSAARLGYRDFPNLWDEAQSTASPDVFEIAFRISPLHQTTQWYNTLKASGLRERDAIRAAAISGDVKFVPDLIAWTTAPHLARLAGFAISMITGVDLAYHDLDKDLDKGPPEAMSEDIVDIDAEEDLPWPDPERLYEWWSRNAQRFQRDRRYLAGNEISVDGLHTTLREGTQPQRWAAALELGLIYPHEPLFPVDAPGRVQLQKLGLWNW
jgi:uncharacterized protein (TIGR02270 family)